MADAEALITDPDREGWRGNRSPWIRRARRFLATATPAEAARVAPAVRDASLLTPGLACLVPLHVRRTGRFNPLWQDTQHRAFTRPRLGEEVLPWLSSLVYVVRHHSRLGGKRATDIRTACPPGALELALEDGTWDYDTGLSVDRTRTIMVLVATDGSASDALLRRAVQWIWTGRPAKHRTSALEWLIRDRLCAEGVDMGPDA